MSAGAPAPPNGTLLERLLRANEEQARSTGALVEIQRDNRDRLGTIEEQSRLQTQALVGMVEKLGRLETGRDAAVEVLKQHVSTSIKLGFSASEVWWRRAFVILGIGVVFAQVLGVGVGRLIDMIGK